MQRNDSENLLGQYIPLHYHYVMLQDELRMQSFREAITMHVKPGMRVVELGGGTGVLSYFAACAGGKVTCVERNPEMVEVAQRLIKENGVQSQVDVVECDACDYVPNESVDVVICEMLHVGLLREKQLEVIAAFKENYSRQFPDEDLPRFIPEASVLMVQTVAQNYHFETYHAPVPLFQSLDREHESVTESISELTPYALVHYGEEFPTRFDVAMELSSNSEGTVNALRFVTQNVLSVDVEEQTAISWPNQALIVPTAEQRVGIHDRVEVGFHYRAGDALTQLTDSLVVAHTPEQLRRAA